MSSSSLKALGVVGLGVLAVLFAGANVSDWAWWETAGTQREQYDAVIIGLNGLAGLCIALGGAFGASRYYRDVESGSGPAGGGLAATAREPVRIDRELFYDAAGSSAGFDLAIKLGFVVLLGGHALIVVSRALT